MRSLRTLSTYTNLELTTQGRVVTLYSHSFNSFSRPTPLFSSTFRRPRRTSPDQRSLLPPDHPQVLVSVPSTVLVPSTSFSPVSVSSTSFNLISVSVVGSVLRSPLSHLLLLRTLGRTPE